MHLYSWKLQKSAISPKYDMFRCGFLAGDSKEISPIFTQFIDTTWQLMNQFPQAFQFNHK